MTKEVYTLLFEALDWVKWGFNLVRWDIVFTSLATLLAAYLATYFRDKRTAKVNHFQSLKSEVLEPILTKLTKYHLPLLEFKVTAVIYDSIPVEEQADDVTLRPIKDWQKVLRITPPGHIPEAWKDLSKHPDVILYADAKKNHFKQLISAWEAFQQKANDYYQRCLRLAKEHEDSIRQKKGSLSELTGLEQKPDFIDLTMFAWWILRKQMGTFPNDSLTVEKEMHGSDRTIIKTGPDQVTLARGLSSQIEPLVKAANELVYCENKIKPLTVTANILVREGREIETKIKDILYTARLQGRCKYY